MARPEELPQQEQGSVHEPAIEEDTASKEHTSDRSSIGRVAADTPPVPDIIAESSKYVHIQIIHE